MSDPTGLRPVDTAEVTILIDNTIDILLPSDAVAKRPPRTWDTLERFRLVAEHGYALAVAVERDGHRSTMLYDAGLGDDSVVRNADMLGMPLGELRAIALSHGHADHHGGLPGLVRRLGARRMPLVLHPDAWLDRKIVPPPGAGSEMHLPPPTRTDVERDGIVVIEERGPTLLVDDAVLVTGEVRRTTDFEPGLPMQQAQRGGRWVPDPLVADDQAIVLHVRGKGLVVLSSCSHSGVVNVLRHAQAVTGVDRIHAFVGGMHLGFPVPASAVARTIDEVVALAPDHIVPGHCTGWRAIHELARRLPDAYVQPSVGTTLRFAAT